MVKSYFRHGGTEVFGLVASNTSNSLFDGKKAYVPALEDVYVWDAKRSEQIAMWHATGHVHPVTFIARSPSNPDRFAVGYQDGSIRIWSAQSKTELSVFEGHRRAISFLAWDQDGLRLASGAIDGEVILWDITGESGLFKLRGHNNRINGLIFLSGSTLESTASSSTALPPSSTHLLSTSQDTYLKLWDLQTQHTVESVVAHRTESWSVTLIPPSLYASQDLIQEDEEPMYLLITTGGDGEAKLWTLSSTVLINGPQRDSSGQGFKRAIVHVGNLALNTSGAHGKRVLGAVAHPFTLRGGASGIAIAFQVGDQSIEIWRIRTIKEAQKHARRKKKEAAKSKKSAEQKDKDEPVQPITWLDRFCPWIMFRGSAKVSSFAFASSSNTLLPASERPIELQILLALSTNSIEVLSIPKPKTSATWASLEPEKSSKVTLPGHRTDIRTVFLSSDDQLLASGSNGSLKIWNLKTQKSIRTMDCGYALCGTWLPGNKHVLVGTKGGQLMLYELSSGTLLQSCEAHTGAVWALDLRPDGKGFVTGGADKCVKFWDFTVQPRPMEPGMDSEASSANQKLLCLSMTHSKTMKMSDDVLGVRYSPDFKLLAVATLDATVKIFFQDTLKFFLSLYGHKLPVLGMDISFDSKLLVTCSADKNVKIWGLEFGDCHKSIFAHEESVMQVRFERGSHYFWTIGRDKLVKYWDGDKFENIQTLSGHHKEVSSLAVSHNAQFLVTSSFDKSIRIWEKTDDPLFLEEEREKELERLYNQEDNDQADLMAVRKRKMNENREEGEVEEAGAVLKQTAETLMSGEKIIEALNLAAQDFEALEKYHSLKASMKDPAMAQKLAPPARSSVFSAFNNLSAHAYVLKVIEKIPRAALEDALLVLPFAQVTMLLTHIDHWIMQGWSGPLVCRILFFILRTHESQITATSRMKVMMNSIQKKLVQSLTKQREMVGYNVEALKFMSQTLESQQLEKQFYDLDLKPVDQVRGMVGGMKKRIKLAL